MLYECSKDMAANQNLEQIARDKLDVLLAASGWIIQDLKKYRLVFGATHRFAGIPNRY